MIEFQSVQKPRTSTVPTKVLILQQRMVLQRLSTTNIDFFVSQSNIQLQQFLIAEIQIN